MPQPSAPPAPDGPRFSLRRVISTECTFADDVAAGLRAVQKNIPPRWFYDDVGSSLFDAICHLPEYYLTRSEADLLRRHGRAIATALRGIRRVAELGSGSAKKTRLLLDHLTAEDTIEYVPLDIDPNQLEKSARALLADYPTLRIHAVCSDFTHPGRALRDSMLPHAAAVVLFLGSTIGNLTPAEAVSMLRELGSILRKGDAILIGADLRKPKEILDAAYNDALGVTAAFNLNLLQRINRELGGHFVLTTFAHRAWFNEGASRIEMHLVSLREQSVRLDGLNLEISFSEGESIHTENSYKYALTDLDRLASEAGLVLETHWTDPNGWFAEVLLRA